MKIHNSKLKGRRGRGADPGSALPDATVINVPAQ